MKKRSLKQHSADFYQNQEMNDHKLEQLLELSTSATDEQPRTIPRSWLNIAAAIIISVSLALTSQHLLMDKDYKSLVPQEIALNHAKQLALEFETDNYIDLDAMMTKLDFQLLASNNTQLNHLKMLGARYCSIQGGLAAQVKLVDEKGIRYTLYQTALTPELKSMELNKTYLDGIEIFQWRENGLFFGLAHSIDQ